MGSAFSCDEATVETRVEEAKEAAAEVAEKVQDAAAAVQEKAADVAGAAADKVADAVETVQETAADAVATAKEGAEGAKEAVISTIDAATAAVTGVMIIEFLEKDTMKKVDFKTSKLGFTYALAGGGCCGPKGQAAVVVKSVAKGGQAESLGVKRNMVLKMVNGGEVTGMDQAKKLLEENAKKLPEA